MGLYSSHHHHSKSLFHLEFFLKNVYFIRQSLLLLFNNDEIQNKFLVEKMYNRIIHRQCFYLHVPNSFDFFFSHKFDER